MITTWPRSTVARKHVLVMNAMEKIVARLRKGRLEKSRMMRMRMQRPISYHSPIMGRI
jgi:hypothetical protein